MAQMVLYLHEVIKIGANSDTAVENNATRVNESTPSKDNVPQNAPTVKNNSMQNLKKNTKKEQLDIINQMFNGVSTVYNVGKIKTDSLPTGKIISRKVGQSPIANLSVETTISQDAPTVKDHLGTYIFWLKILKITIKYDIQTLVMKNEQISEKY